MARAPLFGLRLDEETKARWIAAADRRGYSHLGEFVKACVEREISEQPVPERYHAGTTAVPGGGKRTYEPDFKAEGKKKK